MAADDTTAHQDVRAGNVYLPMIAWTRSEDVLNVEAVAQIQTT